MVVSKLNGRIDCTYNRPIICLVNIYLGYTMYTFTKRNIVEVRHLVNATMKLIYAQSTLADELIKLGLREDLCESVGWYFVCF